MVKLNSHDDVLNNLLFAVQKIAYGSNITAQELLEMADSIGKADASQQSILLQFLSSSLSIYKTEYSHIHNNNSNNNNYNNSNNNFNNGNNNFNNIYLNGNSNFNDNNNFNGNNNNFNNNGNFSNNSNNFYNNNFNSDNSINNNYNNNEFDNNNFSNNNFNNNNNNNNNINVSNNITINNVDNRVIITTAFFSGILEKDMNEYMIKLLCAIAPIAVYQDQIFNEILNKLINITDPLLEKIVLAEIEEMVNLSPEALTKASSLFINFLNSEKKPNNLIDLLEKLFSSSSTTQADNNLEMILSPNIKITAADRLLPILLERCQSPVKENQVRQMLGNFIEDPQIYSCILLDLLKKKGTSVFDTESWTCIFNTIRNVMDKSQNVVISEKMPDLYSFLSFSLTRFASAPNQYLNLIYEVQIFLEKLFHQYISSDNEADWEVYFNTFSLIFRVLFDDSRATKVEAIYKALKKIFFSNSKAQEIYGALSFTYKFISDYEFVNTSLLTRIVRHKINSFKCKTLLTVKCENDSKVYKIRANPTTLIGEIGTAIAAQYSTFSFNVNFKNSLDNKELKSQYTLAEYNLNTESIVTVNVKNVNSCNYDFAFITQFITNDQQTFNFILNIINKDKVDFLANSSEKMKENVVSIAWKLLKILPSSPNLMNDFSDEAKIESALNQRSTELGMKYQLQVILKTFSNLRQKSSNYLAGFNRMSVVETISDKISRNIFSSSQISDAYQILVVYFQNQDRVSSRDQELTKPIADTIINSQNKHACSIALQLLSLLVRKSSSIEDRLLSQPEIIKTIILSKAKIVFVNMFISAFNKPAKLFDILQTMAEPNTDNQPFIRLLLTNMTKILNADCDVCYMIEYIRKQLSKNNLNRPDDDTAISLINFLTESFKIHPRMCVRNLDFLETLYDLMLPSSSERLQSACFHTFSAFCASKNEEVTRKTFNLLKEGVEIETNRWGYSPNTFKKNSNGLCGLRNLGSTCYMNSVFQQLYYNTDMRKAIYSCGDKTNNLLPELRNIFSHLALSNAASVDTEPFTTQWKKDDKTFSPREQADADEFLRRLLDRLPPEIALTFAGNQITIFEGIDVAFRSEIKELFYTILIPVKGYLSFDRAMPTIFVPQLFIGNNQYNEVKLGKIDAKKYLRIESMPNILVFQLKRFDYNLKTCTRLKITDEFQFPFSFEAANYFPGMTEKYMLKGVITHSGTAEGGHYNSLVKRDNLWTDFNDTEATDISDETFISYVKGTDKQDNVRCAYLLFYEKVENLEKYDISEDIVESVTKFLSENEIANIKEENHHFDLMQTVFDESMAKFVIDVDDLMFTLNYFLKVFCHSNLEELIPEFIKRILSYIESEEEASKIAFNFAGNQKLIFEIIKSSSDLFGQAVVKILKGLFNKVRNSSTIKIVDYIVDNLESAIHIWRVLPLFAEVIYAFINDNNQKSIANKSEDDENNGNYDQNSNENDEMAKKRDIWGIKIFNCVKKFYGQSLGNVALSNCDFQYFFQSLEILYMSLNRSETLDFVNKYQQKILQSHSNQKYFDQFKDSVLGVKSAQMATSNPENFCNHISKLTDKDSIKQTFDVCKKPKQWIIDAFEKYFPKVQNNFLTFPSLMLFPLLTDISCDVRDGAESLCYKLFPNIPILENYEKAEKMKTGKVFVCVYFPKTQAEYPDAAAEKFLEDALEYAGEKGRILQERLSHLFRVVHWLKLQTGSTAINNISSLLLLSQRSINNESYDLIELLHLLHTLTPEQFGRLFDDHFNLFMDIICPKKDPHGDQAGRFIMFVSRLNTPDQFIMCLQSDFFFAAYTRLFRYYLQNPFSYLCQSFFKVLNKSQEDKSNNLKLAHTFTSFLADHAEYTFLGPQTREKLPVFYVAIDSMKFLYTSELTTKFINQFFDLFEKVSKSVVWEKLTQLIASIAKAGDFVIDKNRANQIMVKCFPFFLNKHSLKDLLIHCAKSPEFGDAFAATYEDNFLKNPTHKELWRLSEVYTWCAIYSTGDQLRDRISFITQKLTENDEFTKSQGGQQSIELCGKILDDNDYNDEITLPMIGLFLYIIDNSVEITPCVKYFISKYVYPLGIRDLDEKCQNIAEALEDVENPDFDYSVQLLSVFFEIKPELRKEYLENYPLDEDVIDNWPKNLSQYIDMFKL